MPGKQIDRIALFLLSTAGLYLFFLNAWHSIPLACALTFACGALLRQLALRRPPRRRRTAAQAEARLLRVACMDEAEAAPVLEALLRARYPDEPFRVIPVLRHPDAGLSCGDVFNQWKANRGETAIVLAATCGAEPRAVLYARELTGPMVAVADRRALTRLLRERAPEPEEIAAAPSPRARLRRALRRVAARPASPRVALYGLALLGMYLLAGNPVSLAMALALLFAYGASLTRGRAGRRLFRT